MEHRNNRQWIVLGLFGCIIISIIVLMLVNKERHELPSLSEETRASIIRKGAFVAIDRAAAASTDCEFVACAEYLRSVVDRLSRGWDGFAVDEYRPAGYNERDLLGNIFARLAEKTTNDVTYRRKELRLLLYELRPDNQQSYEMWCRLLREYGLDPSLP